MIYAGDLSRQDVQVLASYAAQSNRIIEFGAGASTQVFADNAPPAAEIVTVETASEWINRTRENLKRINRERVDFYSYDDFRAMTHAGRIDLAFDDGINELRVDFALRIWPILRIGGVLLVHDTRHLQHVEIVLEVVRKFHLEIDSIRFNERASNVTAIVKKLAEPYVNWNEVEKISRGAFAVFQNPERTAG